MFLNKQIVSYPDFTEESLEARTPAEQTQCTTVATS